LVKRLRSSMVELRVYKRVPVVVLGTGEKVPDTKVNEKDVSYTK
jgi:hypothetical protein